MASLDSKTVPMERSLLNLLLTSQMTCREHIHRVDPLWFTNDERRFIFACILRLYNETKSSLTEKLFEFEVQKTIPADKHTFFVGEWNLVVGLSVGESIDALIDLLDTALLEKKASAILVDTLGLLEKGEVNEAVAKLKHRAIMLGGKHEDRPIVKVTEHKERKQLVLDRREDPSKYKGIYTGFTNFDQHTGGLFPAELTLIASITGVGKSTFLKMMEYNIITLPQNGIVNILHVTNEENRLQVETKFDAVMSGIPYLDFKRSHISDASIAVWDKIMWEMGQPSHGQIYVKEIPQFTTILEIERAFMELEHKGIKIHLIVLDYCDLMAPVQKSWSENDEQNKVGADCKALSIILDVPVVTATQAATAVEDKQEKGKPFGKLDVYGSKRKIHHANTFMGITIDDYEATADPNTPDWMKNVIWNVRVVKHRDGGTGFQFKLKQIVKTGRVIPWGSKDASETIGTDGEVEDDKKLQEAETEKAPKKRKKHRVEAPPSDPVEEDGKDSALHVLRTKNAIPKKAKKNP